MVWPLTVQFEPKARWAGPPGGSGRGLLRRDSILRITRARTCPISLRAPRGRLYLDGVVTHEAAAFDAAFDEVCLDPLEGYTLLLAALLRNGPVPEMLQDRSVLLQVDLDGYVPNLRICNKLNPCHGLSLLVQRNQSTARKYSFPTAWSGVAHNREEAPRPRRKSTLPSAEPLFSATRVRLS